MLKKADTQLIKLLNEIQLLNLIREEGPISRIELARRTEMSKVTVFEIINRLIEAGFVIDIGKGEASSRGGKRPTLVKLNAGNHFVIGIEYKRTEARIALADIEANVIDKKKIRYSAGADPLKVLQRTCSRIDRMLKSDQASADKLVSIGIGVPGLINYEEGRLYFADTLRHWDTIPIAHFFSERYNVPAILENDVNTITIGESILGAGKEYSNIVNLWIGDGVGAGIILHDQLVQGLAGGAGEIGYLELNGFCNSAKLSYLYEDQQYFGDILQVKHLQSTLAEHLGQYEGKPADELTFRQIIHIAEKDKGVLGEILDEYIRLVAILCMSMIKMINPEVLILSGKVVEQSKNIFERIKQSLRENGHRFTHTSTKIRRGHLKEEAGLRGAIAMALEVIFEAKMSNRPLQNKKR